MDINHSQKQPNSDLIVELPTDENQPTHSELKIINTLFVVKKNNNKNIMLNLLKYVFLILLIVVFYFIPTDMLKQFSPTVIIFTKAILLSFLYYIFETYAIKG
jgi:hypothetical protein